VEQRFTPSTHRLALWAGGPVMTVLYVAGWLVFAQMIPTPSPHWSAEELAQWIVDHKPGLSFGCFLMIAGCGLWGTWLAQTIVWTFRTEARFPVLTFTQLLCGAAGLTFFIFDTLFWAVAVFRAGEVDPQITQQMWDVGWFGFLFTITVYIAWAVAWALGILLNPPQYQVFPRWAAYVTFGSVICWSPGLLIIFFKEGPFSYSGVLAMWLPITEFFIWLLIIDVCARKAIRRQVEISTQEAAERGDAYGVHPTRDPDLPSRPTPAGGKTLGSPLLVGGAAALAPPRSRS
jgi:hypothetical protein